jgi:hypothetical protein
VWFIRNTTVITPRRMWDSRLTQHPVLVARRPVSRSLIVTTSSVSSLILTAVLRVLRTPSRSFR